MRPNSTNNTLPIVYYDGQCHVCDGLIIFLKNVGAENKLHLIPFQLVMNDVPNELMLTDGSSHYIADEALLKLLAILGGGFLLMAWLLKILPKPWRRRCYYYLAGNRYRFFGKRSCSIT
ncbi:MULTISPECIES: thiol-disulfide oxidoreductase DCC family protein [unclassified Carboxylicivirga]|uniref:thiol-disulfide oxidoreductase DCC family protein n=1 Tax=Carboxylicivirga TaxID=1628153 RepID=UPI003D3598C2